MPTDLYSIMAEEITGVSGHGHLQTGGITPQIRLADQQFIGITCFGLVACAKHICQNNDNGKKLKLSFSTGFIRHQKQRLSHILPWAIHSNFVANSFMESLASVSISSLDSSLNILHPPRAVRTDSPHWERRVAQMSVMLWEHFHPKTDDLIYHNKLIIIKVPKGLFFVVVVVVFWQLCNIRTF